MINAKLLKKKLINGQVVDKWDLVKIIEAQEIRIKELEKELIELKEELSFSYDGQ